MYTWPNNRADQADPFCHEMRRGGAGPAELPFGTKIASPDRIHEYGNAKAVAQAGVDGHSSGTSPLEACPEYLFRLCHKPCLCPENNY